MEMRNIFFCLLFLGCGPASSFAQSASVDPLDRQNGYAAALAAGPAWITDGLEKNRTGDGPGATRPLYLSGGRNEYVSFQVHVRAGANPINLNVEVGDFVNTVTPTLKIARATQITVYREAYLKITQLSDLNGRKGWTPDPLIPTVDPYFRQARRAFPITVPATRTRSAWIDVLIPLNAAAGLYRGTVTVKDGANVVAALQPVIKVWKFALPSTPTLKSTFNMGWNAMCVAAYGSYFNCSNFPGSGGSNDRGTELTHVQQALMALDHRITLSNVVYSPSSTWAYHDALYGALFSGTANTQLKGAAFTTAQFIHSGHMPPATATRDWVAHYGANGWLPKLFDYTCDEPTASTSDCNWAEAKRRLQNIRAGSAMMPTLVTTSIDSARANGALDLIDILSPLVNDVEPKGQTNRRSTYDSWLAQPRKHLWWYQSCMQHESCANGFPGGATSTWPSYMIDSTPVRNRVFQWLAFLDRIEGELYWGTDYCWIPANCPQGDPWKSVYAFGGNGDGTLTYPGTTNRIGGTMPIPLPSIRFKLIRDGMQDYEYLAALQRLGQGAFATSIARGFITDATHFNNNPAAMAAAHEALGNKLDQLTP